KLENVGLENAISFGWTIIQPFTKGILFVLMFLKKYINNYGLVLILFAFIVRIVTGPLTKKAAISSQKMQSIQPKLQKIQKKYKNNPQKLNAETIALYRDNGVNPLGGCLPILIQMPLLFSLFLVFRTTIEFRGAGFFWWINDLSQPDVIFELPFSVPLYGSYVCLLPLLMSITMFIQQSYTMAKNVDKNTKIMMQSMSLVFFLIFNTFPSGLNLYYTVTNILSIFQQRSIRKNLNS
ncbi:MAG: protein translocase component YidC, partial [Candidatus Marinimicrobia bacterium]|nr:protein translocase component YidC [Candidatus Neomarinimicrobiota bacterium]